MASRNLGLAAVCFCLVAGAGCKPKQLPDPNDPNQVGSLQPDVLRRDLMSGSDSLWDRRVKGEISDAQYQQYMQRYATELVQSVHIEKVPPTQAWEYGEVFKAAKRWKEAASFYEIAVKAAPNQGKFKQDRFINDSLHLAVCYSHLGRVKEAIPLAKATFKSDDNEKAPILTGILLELAPAARGQGDDVDLANLLEGAIGQSEKTIVDSNSEAGKAFLYARPFQIRQAWGIVVDLLAKAGKPDLAAAARQRAQADLKTQANA